LMGIIQKWGGVLREAQQSCFILLITSI